MRRPTGGSAIYHDGPERELTYSVAATAGDLGIGSDLLETYRWIGAAAPARLRALGAPAELVPERPPAGPVPAFCFARTGVFEIEVGGRKIVGSAQRRQGDSFLQHGAVLLGIDEPRAARAVPDHARSAGDADHAGGGARTPAVVLRRVAEALAAAFEEEHGLACVPGGLSDEETERVTALVTDRYASPAWLATPA